MSKSKETGPKYIPGAVDPSPDEVYREMAAKGLISEENESPQPSQSPEDEPKPDPQL